jgi:hypothetical protein
MSVLLAISAFHRCEMQYLFVSLKSFCFLHFLGFHIHITLTTLHFRADKSLYLLFMLCLSVSTLLHTSSLSFFRYTPFRHSSILTFHIVGSSHTAKCSPPSLIPRNAIEWYAASQIPAGRVLYDASELLVENAEITHGVENAQPMCVEITQPWACLGDFRITQKRIIKCFANNTTFSTAFCVNFPFRHALPMIDFAFRISSYAAAFIVIRNSARPHRHDCFFWFWLSDEMEYLADIAASPFPPTHQGRRHLRSSSVPVTAPNRTHATAILVSVLHAW